MNKVGSVPLFNQKVFYDLPEESNSLEMRHESPFHYKSSKRSGSKETKQYHVNIPSNDKFPIYNSGNSGSLGSSPESSTDPDSSPTEDPPQLIDDFFWNEISTYEKVVEGKKTNFEDCENSSVIDCQSTKEIGAKDTRGNYSQGKKLSFERNSVSSNKKVENKSSFSAAEFCDNFRNSDFENQQGNSFVIFPSVDEKDPEFESGMIFDNILSYCSSSVIKDDCLSNMLTESPTFNIQCDIPGDLKNSSDETTTFSDLFSDICLSDKNDERTCSGFSPSSGDLKNSSEEATTFSDLFSDICLADKNDERICSGSSSTLSDIDSFLNSVNLIESAESNVFKPATKQNNLKNSSGIGLSNENVTAPVVIKNSYEETLTFPNSFDDICLNNKRKRTSCSISLSDIDSFLNSVDLIEPAERSVIEPETKDKNIGNLNAVLSSDENISLATLAEQHLQSNATSNAPCTTSKIENCLGSESWFHLHSLSKMEKFEDNTMLELLTDLSQKISNEEIKMIEKADENDDSLDIDLTSCLKSLRPATPVNDSVNVESDSQNLLPDKTFSVPPYRFSPPLITQKFDDSPSKIKEVNANQSLFAKALSCKPKKDLSAMLKVLKLQSQVCNLLFSPPQMPHNSKPAKENAVESSQSVIESVGKRVFGQIPKCEVS